MQKIAIFLLVTVFFGFSFQQEILAFCGFYVARADAKLFNKASRVVLVRNGKRTVIGMMNDYQGKLKDFAMVIPVPVVLKRQQINVGDAKVFDHLDAYTAPRLVEYHDSNPCEIPEAMDDMTMDKGIRPSGGVSEKESEKKLGVKVEASYSVGEYNIKILSAKYSNGLETWLRRNKYKIPKGANKALQPYIRQKMKFFVAKVNLKKQLKTGLNYLRPLQFAFESEKFMLPIRLGMLNANGEQELLVYVLTKNGRVETSNYRTVKLPSNVEIPEYTKEEFGSFYKSMFDRQVAKQEHKAVFTEYFWDMSWCDPCAANPLSAKELRSLGVFWLDGQNTGQAQKVMATRLHLKYTNKTFPEDLMFQETNDRQNFQGRYIIRHPWNGSPQKCSAAKSYFENLEKWRLTRANTLADLTGWRLADIHKKMRLEPNIRSNGKEWWQKIWN
ncbi:MAG: DUF2330 domain-containing protein [Spirochaetota bacterium]